MDTMLEILALFATVVPSSIKSTMDLGLGEAPPVEKEISLEFSQDFLDGRMEGNANFRICMYKKIYQ